MYPHSYSLSLISTSFCLLWRTVGPRLLHRCPLHHSVSSAIVKHDGRLSITHTHWRGSWEMHFGSCFGILPFSVTPDPPSLNWLWIPRKCVLFQFYLSTGSSNLSWAQLNNATVPCAGISLLSLEYEMAWDLRHNSVLEALQMQNYNLRVANSQFKT